MNARVLLLLFVYKPITCHMGLDSKTTLYVPNMEKCKNIKCSTEEDPRCVRIKHSSSKNKTHYVIIINKCELQYMKCHKDYVANIVPMNRCLQKNKIKTATTAINPGPTYTHDSGIQRGPPSRRRARPRPRQEGPALIKRRAAHEAGFKVELADIYDSDEVMQLKEFYSTKHADEGASKEALDAEYIPTEMMPLTVDDNTQHAVELHIGDYDSDAPDSSSKDTFGKSLVEDYDDDYYSDASESFSKETIGKSKVQPYNAEYNRDASESFSEETIGKSIAEVRYGQDESNTFELFSKETIDKRKAEAENAKDYELEDCPDACPTRNIMICALSSKGVYHTFQSSCHLRNYVCKKTVKETFQLVARRPCVMSAPWIVSPGPKDSPKVLQQEDRDVYLNFFKCRSLGILGKADPRCPY